MDPAELASCVVLLAASILLVAAGSTHVRHRRVFGATLRRHGLLAPALGRRIAGLIGPVEAAVGGAVLLCWTITAPLGVAGVAVCALYGAFGAYAALALRRAPGAPCGCFGGDEPLTPLVPARAAVLALGSLPALTVTPPASGGTRLVVLGAGVLVAVLAWAVPAVLALSSAQDGGAGHRE